LGATVTRIHFERAFKEFDGRLPVSPLEGQVAELHDRIDHRRIQLEGLAQIPL
jgi:hypothetical protein